MGEALQKKPSQEGRFLFNCHDRRMKAYLDRRWNTWGPPGWRREYEERAGVMEEKRTPPELARAMMELLGCPCTYFAPMWDDDPLLECLQMNLEPEGGVHGITPEQAAARYWHERHGAVPCAVTHDALECQLPRPMAREESIALTLEQ